MSNLKGLAIYNVAGQIIKTVITIAAPIILVRLMSVEEYGEYQTILLITGLVTTVLGFNFIHNLWYFYPSAKDKKEKRLLLSNNLFVMFIVAISLIIISLLLKDFIVASFNLDLYSDIYIYGVLLVSFSLLYQSVNNIFLLEAKGKVLLYYPTINQLFRILMVLGAYMLFSSIKMVIIGLLIWSILNTIFFVGYIWFEYNASPFAFNKNVFKKQFKYIWPFGVSSFIGTFGNRADKLILTALFTASDFAIYRVGNFKLPFISTIYSSIGNTILPRLSELSGKEGGKIKAMYLWQKLVVRQAFVTFPIVFYFIFIASDFIVLLFGQEYSRSAIVFQLFLTSFFIEMFGFGYLLRGFADTKPMLYANITKFMVAVIGGWVLINQFSFVGAATTYVLAYASDGFVQLYFTKKHLKINFKSLIPWKELVILALVSLILLFLLIITKEIIFSNMYLLFYFIITSIVFFSLYFIIISRIRRFEFANEYYELIMNKIVGVFKNNN